MQRDLCDFISVKAINTMLIWTGKINYAYALKFSASDKAKLFAKNFSKNANLDDSNISLPVFSFRTNLKLYNISVTAKLVKKVITILDSSKASGPDCIPVVVLLNSKAELSYIVAELYVSERVLFSRLLEGLISGPCI